MLDVSADFSCVVEVVVSADSGADCDDVSFVVDDVSVEDAVWEEVSCCGASDAVVVFVSLVVVVFCSGVTVSPVVGASVVFVSVCGVVDSTGWSTDWSVD
ncbi:hypothetical protein BU043_02020 [Staphylococcus simulans]|uniref:hypothetical protein n=1 Tax=Staphylococcus simulans TaxID=1286 RepID=UPI000E69DC6D|nr:hypothetical protein [Staphylococcus simulans]RIN43838.1 hypothetical protein BU043_02020 [Staphylococcus simulans]